MFLRAKIIHLRLISKKKNKEKLKLCFSLHFALLASENQGYQFYSKFVF